MRGLRLVFVATVIMILVNSVSAEVPQLINIQGDLTETGPTAATLRLIRGGDDQSGGTIVYTEDVTLNCDTNGLFTHLIGSAATEIDGAHTLSPSDFASSLLLWVEIEIGGMTLLPRTQLVTGPFAEVVGTIDQASGGTIQGSIAITDKARIGPGAVNTGDYSFAVGFTSEATGTSSTVTGGQFNSAEGSFSVVGGGSYNRASGLSATVPGGAADSALGDYSFAAGVAAVARHKRSFVWSDGSVPKVFQSTAKNQFLVSAAGGVGINNNQPAEALDVEGNILASGTITSGNSITIDGSTDQITASSGTLDLSSNSDVILPDDALSSSQIVDEPGISFYQSVSLITIPPDPSDPPIDVVTTTITIPASGVIFVSGSGEFRASGTTGLNQITIGLGETPGVFTGAVRYVSSRTGSTSEDHNTFCIERSFLKSAGTYTFRLQSQTAAGNGSGAVNKIWNPVIKAVFYPTQY